MSSRRSWTEEEIKYLEESYGKLPAKTIAVNLNRTVFSIDNKASKLKDSCIHGKKKTNVKPKIEEILEYSEYGLKPYQIANILNLSVDKIESVINES